MLGRTRFFAAPVLALLTVFSLHLACGALIVRQQTTSSLLAARGFVWASHATDDLTVHAEAAAPQAPQVATIADDAIVARRAILDTLEVADYAPHLSIFLVDTRERMQALIGRRTNATGFAESNSVCIVWPRAGRAGLRHETAHVIAMNLWGVPERWFNEGFAVDVTGDWIGRDLDAVTRALRDQGELPALDDLVRRFESIPSALAYPAAGSFVRMLRQDHGLAVVREFWSGGKTLPQATGRTLEQLEVDWMARLDAVAADGETYDWKSRTPSDDRD